MAADIKQHVLECGLCNARAKAYRLAGYGLVALVLDQACVHGPQGIASMAAGGDWSGGGADFLLQGWNCD